MGRVANNEKEIVREYCEQIPEEKLKECAMCSLEVFNLVNDGVQRTKSKPGTIIKELSRKTGVKESVLYSRYRNLNTGRRPSSKEKAQTDIPEGGHNAIPHEQVPPPMGEEKPKMTPASLLDEIDAEIQGSRDAQPKCFMRFGTGVNCDECQYNLPCQANTGATTVEPMPTTPPSIQDDDLAHQIALAVEGPSAPMSERETFKSLTRPAEWTRLMEKLRESLSDPNSKMRTSGLSPQVAAFDLATLAMEVGESGLRAALEGDD